jgi:hypothetical protein
MDTHPVKRLVVNARPEDLEVQPWRNRTCLFQQLLLLVLKRKLSIPTLAHQIHFVHQNKHVRTGTVPLQRIEDSAEVLHVGYSVPGLDLEDVDKHTNGGEDSGLLSGEVLLHVRVLPAAVPEVENQVAEETDMVLLDVGGDSQTRCKRCRVIGADGDDMFQYRIHTSERTESCLALTR